MLDDIEDLSALFESRGTMIRWTRSEEHDLYVTPGYRIEDDPSPDLSGRPLLRRMRWTTEHAPTGALRAGQLPGLAGEPTAAHLRVRAVAWSPGLA